MKNNDYNLYIRLTFMFLKLGFHRFMSLNELELQGEFRKIITSFHSFDAHV